MKNERLVIVFLILLFSIIINPVSILINSFNIYPNDIIAFFLIIRFVFRLKRFKQNLVPSTKRMLLTFALILVINFLIGYHTYSKYSFVQFRDHLYTFSALFYFASFNYSERIIKKIFAILLIFSTLLCIIAVGNWLNLSFFVNNFGGFSSQIANYNIIKRPLNSEQALFVGSSFLILLISYLNKIVVGFTKLIFLAFLMIIIILAQVRSVWVAIFLALLISTILLNIINIKKIIHFGISILFIIILILIIRPDILNELFNSLSGSVTETFQYNSTFEWRILGWAQLVLMPKGIQIFIGQPFGTSLFRIISFGVSADNSAHSYYISQYIRSGIIGLISILSVHIWVLVKSNRLRAIVKKKFDKNLLSIISSLMIMYLIYFITYSSTQIYGMIVGITLSYIHSINKNNYIKTNFN